jgi:adenylate cyclase
LRIGDLDVFGQEVNASSKLGEDTAKAGEIIVRKAVHDLLNGQPNVEFRPLEEIPSGVEAAYKVIY